MYGRIAQSVEQRIENPRVPGSIPGPATIIQNEKPSLIAGFFVSKPPFQIGFNFLGLHYT